MSERKNKITGSIKLECKSNGPSRTKLDNIKFLIPSASNLRSGLGIIDETIVEIVEKKNRSEPPKKDIAVQTNFSTSEKNIVVTSSTATNTDIYDPDIENKNPRISHSCSDVEEPASKTAPSNSPTLKQSPSFSMKYSDEGDILQAMPKIMTIITERTRTSINLGGPKESEIVMSIDAFQTERLKETIEWRRKLLAFVSKQGRRDDQANR